MHKGIKSHGPHCLKAIYIGLLGAPFNSIEFLFPRIGQITFGLFYLLVKLQPTKRKFRQNSSMYRQFTGQCDCLSKDTTGLTSRDQTLIVFSRVKFLFRRFLGERSFNL